MIMITQKLLGLNSRPWYSMSLGQSLHKLHEYGCRGGQDWAMSSIRTAGGLGHESQHASKLYVGLWCVLLPTFSLSLINEHVCMNNVNPNQFI